MATYAVGDLQGCLAGLQTLLSRLHFDAGRDRLLLTGDLVARGPDSLETLRFVRSLGRAVVTVLGNHDLHLLALAARGQRGKPDDRLDQVLDAPDADSLLHWLRQQRLAYRDRRHRALMIHAGLAPQWTADDALRLAREVEAALRDEKRFAALVAGLYGDEPRRWDESLRGTDRLRAVVNILTRARVCDADGNFDYRFKRNPQQAPDGLMPWFAVPGRRSQRTTVLFGHWSTLGTVHWPQARVYGLDTGYVWGGRLTALRLDDGQLFQQAAARVAGPLPAAG